MSSQGIAVAEFHMRLMEAWSDEPSNEPETEPVCVVSRLRKLPASPFRSAGGYLNYAGWPDCQRFMELDRAIQLRAHESQNGEDDADTDDQERICSIERRPETVDDAYRTPRRPHSHEVIRGLAALPFRRL